MPATIVIPTQHAEIRMQQRRISQTDIEAVVTYGREFHHADAVIYVIGRREVRAYSKVADLTQLQGLHAIVGPRGELITTYRNSAFSPKKFSRRRGH